MHILASFLGSLKSAALSKKKTFICPYNKLVIKICNLLYDLGYIYGFTILDPKKIKINLKFANNKSAIRSLNLVTKSSLRVYLKKKNLKGRNILPFINTNSFLILSTSKDTRFLTDVECFMLNTGGEPFFLVS
jgi:small subunit ribosomal protein S8